MLQKIILMLCLVYSSHLLAGCPIYAIQGSIATGGAFGIGITRYTETTEIGISGSAYFDNHGTKLGFPVLFGGFRHELNYRTFFAYGIDSVGVFGKIDHHSIRRAIRIGPYISLEQQLTPCLLFIGWIDPYFFEYEKTRETSFTAHRVFAAGGLGLSYYF